MHICIALFLKDAVRYLQSYLFQKLDDLEHFYKTKHTFSYILYDNDSSDYTAEFMKMFSKLPSREGRVHVHVKTYMDKTQSRQDMLNVFRDQLCQSDWTLFIDNNIYFEVEYLKHMLYNASHAGIITCNSISVQPNIGDNAAEKPFVSSKHYYDTYSCVDINYNLHYPVCQSPECTLKSCEEACVPKWNQSNNIVEVQSAWGGFVLVNSKAFRHEDVVWDTVSVDNNMLNIDDNEINFTYTEENKKCMCEHVLFCNKVKNALSRPIVIVTDISPYWIAS